MHDHSGDFRIHRRIDSALGARPTGMPGRHIVQGSRRRMARRSDQSTSGVIASNCLSGSILFNTRLIRYLPSRHEILNSQRPPKLDQIGRNLGITFEVKEFNPSPDWFDEYRPGVLKSLT